MATSCPPTPKGRIIGAVLMLQGIGFITVIAAAVTAALIEQARKRRNADEEPATTAHFKQIEARLEAIERALDVKPDADRTRRAEPVNRPRAPRATDCSAAEAQRSA